MLPCPDLWLLLPPPKFAMVSPPRLSLGLRIRLSSSVKIEAGTTAPRKISLLWIFMSGSVNAKHTASFGSIGSAKTSDAREILLDDAGKGTVLSSSKLYISLLNGFLRNPKKQVVFAMSFSARQNLSLVYSSFVKMNTVSLLKG